MLRILLFLCCILCHSTIIAQIRLVRLEVNKNEKYFIEGTDILYADTLIMNDSSELVLNHEKRVNQIHSKVTIIGKDCIITGMGATSPKGKQGIAGVDQNGPCKSGKNGGSGLSGSHGLPANDLFLYLTDLNIGGSLIINLDGGEGGDGGDGGPGGSGGPGTRVCEGGNGGNGGNGAMGGNGGTGGTLSIQCKNCPNVRGLISRSIILKNYGGYRGLGGDGGAGGSPGLGPLKDGHRGKKGLTGKEGADGKSGTIHFISN